MRFNIGDLVRVREWDDMADEFRLTGRGDIRCYPVFTAGMKYLCGEELVVSFVSEGLGSDGYKLKSPTSAYIFPWRFSEDVLVPIAYKDSATYSNIDTDWVQDMLSEFNTGGDEM